jgi:CheY-like chemotaxis protein
MPESPTLSRTILVADDEPLTLRAIQSALMERGFIVQSASDGTQGLALVDQIGHDLPELLITDMDMPGYCGEEVAEYARKRFQTIKVLFTSGEPQPRLLKSIASDPNTRFLEKPFMQAELLNAIRELGVAL